MPQMNLYLVAAGSTGQSIAPLGLGCLQNAARSAVAQPARRESPQATICRPSKSFIPWGRFGMVEVMAKKSCSDLAIFLRCALHLSDIFAALRFRAFRRAFSATPK